MTDTPFIRPRRLSDPPLRVVVLPHAGGSGSAYYPLHRELPLAWDLLLCDLPGRGKRHSTPHAADMADLVARVTEDLLPHTDVPLAVFGHSLGAVLAAEVSRALHRHGVPPVWTGVSGHVAPGAAAPTAPLDAEAPDDVLLARLAAMGGLPPRAAEVPAFRARFLALVRADLRVFGSYRAGPERQPLRTALTAFGSTDDPLAPPETLPPWGRETTGEYRERVYQGGHFHFLGTAFPGFSRDLATEIHRALRLGTARDHPEHAVSTD